MKIAVTYEDGKIYQHFGHCEAFKLYTAEGGKVVSSEVAETNGTGHGALAGFLRERGVDALICGGIGGGAVAALSAAGIALYAGAEGDADAAVGALLAGELRPNSAANCDHHGHDEGHGCGSHGHDCGGHENHCGGHGHGCGSR